jgi:hypothetical protein
VKYIYKYCKEIWKTKARGWISDIAPPISINTYWYFNLMTWKLPNFFGIYTPRKQSLGGYIGITLSVRLSIRPSMYLVSTTPPKLLIGFL